MALYNTLAVCVTLSAEVGLYVVGIIIIPSAIDAENYLDCILRLAISHELCPNLCRSECSAYAL